MRKQLVSAVLFGLLFSKPQASAETWFAIPQQFQRDAAEFYVPEKTFKVVSVHVYVDPAWFSAEIDFYQPVLKEGFRGLSIEIIASKSAQEIMNKTFYREQDLWYGRGANIERETARETEPYTGLKVLYIFGLEIPAWRY